MAKQKIKPTAKNKQQTEGNKRPREDAKEKKIDEKIVDDNEMGGVDEYGKEQLEKKEKKKQMNDVDNVGKRRLTRGQRNQRVGIELSPALMMAAHIADTQLKKMESMRLPIDEDVFGHESFTYVHWDDFEAVFSMNELSGGVISSYIM